MAFSTLNSPSSLSSTDLVEVEGTARWARVVAIAGFVFLGLTLILGIVLSRMLGKVLAMQALMTGQVLPFDPSVVGMVYLVVTVFIVVIYFFPAFFLFQYAQRTLRSVHNGFDPGSFTDGLRAHRSFYTYTAILLIILGALYLLSMALVLAAFSTLPALPAGMDAGMPM